MKPKAYFFASLVWMIATAAVFGTKHGAIVGLMIVLTYLFGSHAGMYLHSPRPKPEPKSEPGLLPVTVRKPVLKKDVCTRCCLDSAIYNPDEYGWDRTDDREWKLGKVNCPRRHCKTGNLQSQRIDQIPEHCPNKEKHK